MAETDKKLSSVAGKSTLDNPNQRLASKMSVYKRFDPDNDIIASTVKSTTGLWQNNITLNKSAMAYKSTNTSSYFLGISASNTAEGEYDVFTTAYGFSGSGYNTESLTMYKQYANVFVGASGTGSADFNFSTVANASKSDASGFIALHLFRGRYQDQLEPGTWELSMASQISGSPYTASVVTSSFVDGAASASNPTVRESNVGRWDYIYSGTRKSNALGTIANDTIYGIVFHDWGALILDSNKTEIGSGSDNATADNLISDGNTLGTADFFNRVISITGKGVANLKSAKYFCRLGNRNFNFSQNPTFYYPNTGEITRTELKENPRTYVTTVGLYNEDSELICSGKLEKPLEKTFENEIILRVRTDF